MQALVYVPGTRTPGGELIAVGVIAGATVGAVAVLIIVGVLMVVGVVFLTKRRSQKVKLLGYNVSLSLRYTGFFGQ